MAFFLNAVPKGREVGNVAILELLNSDLGITLLVSRVKVCSSGLGDDLKYLLVICPLGSVRCVGSFAKAEISKLELLMESQMKN